MQKKRESGFTGTVNARLKLQDIIQMACIARTTSTIKASRGNQKGYIYVNQVRLVHVTVATLSGQEALNELVSWDGGNLIWLEVSHPIYLKPYLETMMLC
jgi:hypothetical protein